MDESFSFSADYVIDAYIRGLERGRNDSLDNIIEIFKQKVYLTGKLAAELSLKMQALGILPRKSYVRVDSLDSLEVMMVISKADFLKDEILEVYAVMHELEDQNSNENYFINFSILDSDGEHDEDAIAADGYLAFLSNLFP